MTTSRINTFLANNYCIEKVRLSGSSKTQGHCPSLCGLHKTVPTYVPTVPCLIFLFIVAKCKAQDPQAKGKQERFSVRGAVLSPYVL